MTKLKINIILATVALSLLALLALSSSTSAQTTTPWQISGNNVYYTNGSVGIGTSDPTSLLTLRKSALHYPIGITQNKIGGEATMELTTADATEIDQASRMVLRGKSNNPDIEFYTGKSGEEELFVAFDGDTRRVGIGMSSPSTLLGLKGGSSYLPVGLTQGKVGGIATLELTTSDYSDSNQASRILLRGGVDAADIEFYRGRSGREVKTVHIEGDNGNVGINKSNPTYKLTVNGSVCLGNC